MTPDEFQQELKRLEKEFKDYFDKYAAKIAGNIAVSYFKKNYETESWGRVKWKEVKRRLNPNTKGARAIHQILVETGDLKRSISVKNIDDNTDDNKVTIWTDPSQFVAKEPYGRVHNEGLKAGRGIGFIMPKRQFMGDSEELNDLIIEEIEKRLNEIINNSTQSPQ